MKLLVIEDDAVASSYLCKALKESGHVVDSVDDGMKGLLRATSESYDVLIVDRMLPSLDGLTVIETLRKTGNETPVLIVSALGEVDERVRGLLFMLATALHNFVLLLITRTHSESGGSQA